MLGSLHNSMKDSEERQPTNSVTILTITRKHFTHYLNANENANSMMLAFWKKNKVKFNQVENATRIEC